MDSANDANGSYPKYIRVASVAQKAQHLWHLATLKMTLEIAVVKPKCCISTATTIAINAIHTIALTQ